MYTIHNKRIKILIIRLSSIGDILLSTPFVRQVRQAFPNAVIDFILKSTYQDLLRANPNIDSLIVLDTEQGIRGLNRIRQGIKSGKYTYIFDLHNNIRSKYLRRGIKAVYKNTIRKDKIKQIGLVYFKKNRYETILSIPDRYLETGRAVGICDDGLGLDIYWDHGNEQSLKKLLEREGISLSEPYICVAPGASFFTKRWPLEYFEKLLSLIQREFHLPCIIIGGDDVAPLGMQLERSAGTFDLSGKTSFLETAIVLSRSRMLVSNDSGLMHMASAVKTPVIAIYGSSVKELGFYPFRSRHKIIEVKGLKCRPCSHIGRQNCPKKHFKCMRDIAPGLVLKEIKSELRKSVIKNG